MNIYNYFNIIGIFIYIYIGFIVFKNFRNLFKGYIYIYFCIVVLFILIYVVYILFIIKFKNYVFL